MILPEVLCTQAVFDSGVRVSRHALENYHRRVDSEATVMGIRQHFLRCVEADDRIVEIVLVYAGMNQFLQELDFQSKLSVRWDGSSTVFTSVKKNSKMLVVSVYCLADLERFDETRQYVPR